MKISFVFLPKVLSTVITQPHYEKKSCKIASKKYNSTVECSGPRH